MRDILPVFQNICQKCSIKITSLCISQEINHLLCFHSTAHSKSASCLVLLDSTIAMVHCLDISLLYLFGTQLCACVKCNPLLGEITANNTNYINVSEYFDSRDKFNISRWIAGYQSYRNNHGPAIPQRDNDRRGEMETLSIIAFVSCFENNSSKQLIRSRLK